MADVVRGHCMRCGIMIDGCLCVEPLPAEPDVVPFEEIKAQMGATMRGRYGTEHWPPGLFTVDPHPDGLFGFRCNVPTCRLYRAPYTSKEEAAGWGEAHARTHGP